MLLITLLSLSCKSYLPDAYFPTSQYVCQETQEIRLNQMYIESLIPLTYYTSHKNGNKKEGCHIFTNQASYFVVDSCKSIKFKKEVK